MKPAAFLFDMDGTLVDNMSFHTRAWVAFFAQRGMTLDEDEFFRLTAGRQSHEIMRTYLGDGLSDGECADLNRIKEDIYRSLYAPHRALIAGFRSFAQDARMAGVELAVATAANDKNIGFILDHLGIRDCFKVVVGAADVARGKPHPDVFLKAALGCGVEPQHCVVFEDAPLGVEAAARAGMAAVVLTTSLGHGGFRQFTNIIGIGDDFSHFDTRNVMRVLHGGSDRVAADPEKSNASAAQSQAGLL